MGSEAAARKRSYFEARFFQQILRGMLKEMSHKSPSESRNDQEKYKNAFEVLGRPETDPETDLENDSFWKDAKLGSFAQITKLLSNFKIQFESWRVDLVAEGTKPATDEVKKELEGLAKLGRFHLAAYFVRRQQIINAIQTGRVDLPAAEDVMEELATKHARITQCVLDKTFDMKLMMESLGRLLKMELKIMTAAYKRRLKEQDTQRLKEQDTHWALRWSSIMKGEMVRMQGNAMVSAIVALKPNFKAAAAAKKAAEEQAVAEEPAAAIAAAATAKKAEAEQDTADATTPLLKHVSDRDD